MLVLEATQPVPLSRREGGTIHVTGSRVTLDTIVACYEQGDSAEEVAEAYPSVDLAQVYGVITYFLAHRDEIREYLREREEQARALRAKIEREFPTAGLRARLLARQATKAASSSDSHAAPDRR